MAHVTRFLSLYRNMATLRSKPTNNHRICESYTKHGRNTRRVQHTIHTISGALYLSFHSLNLSLSCAALTIPKRAHTQQQKTVSVVRSSFSGPLCCSAAFVKFSVVPVNFLCENVLSWCRVKIALHKNKKTQIRRSCVQYPKWAKSK